MKRCSRCSKGEIWVVRHGAKERLPECVQDPSEAGYAEARDAPCWRDGRILDIFDSEGRYLGEVEVHVGFRTAPAPFSRVPFSGLCQRRRRREVSRES